MSEKKTLHNVWLIQDKVPIDESADNVPVDDPDDSERKPKYFAGLAISEVTGNQVSRFEPLSAATKVYKNEKGAKIGARIEFTGNDADTVSFNMTLSQILGVKVAEELDKLKKYKKTGKTLKFVIGKRVIGNYRWVITKLNVTEEIYGKKSELITAGVAITLKEYNK